MKQRFERKQAQWVLGRKPAMVNALSWVDADERALTGKGGKGKGHETAF
jgi:hypothetical protein